MDMASKNQGLTKAAAKKMCWCGYTFQQYKAWVEEDNTVEFKKALIISGITGATQIKQIDMFGAMVKVYGPRRDVHDQEFLVNEAIENERIQNEVDEEMAALDAETA